MTTKFFCHEDDYIFYHKGTQVSQGDLLMKE